MLLSGVSKSAMQMNLERSSDSLFFETFVRNARRVRRGMIDTYARPAAVRRRGEAPRVASRGEHGHSSAITQPMIRFCPDRDERETRYGAVVVDAQGAFCFVFFFFREP